MGAGARKGRRTVLERLLYDSLNAVAGAYAESLARGRAVRLALNQVMADESALLVEGAEVGFFPPVTGG